MTDFHVSEMRRRCFLLALLRRLRVLLDLRRVGSGGEDVKGSSGGRPPMSVINASCRASSMSGLSAKPTSLMTGSCPMRERLSLAPPSVEDDPAADTVAPLLLRTRLYGELGELAGRWNASDV